MKLSAQDILNEHLDVMKRSEALLPQVEAMAETIVRCLQNHGKLLICGNGGSAADAQHFAAELVGRFVTERRPLPAIALTTDTSILTAVGNDYGYEDIFGRQVQALCRPRDIVIGYSTSGNSPNVLEALRAAKEIGAATIGLTGGDGGKLAKHADQCLLVPSKVPARIQEAHELFMHIICQKVDEAFTLRQSV